MYLVLFQIRKGFDIESSQIIRNQSELSEAAACSGAVLCGDQAATRLYSSPCLPPTQLT